METKEKNKVPDAFYLADKFMRNLSVGNKFKLCNKNYLVKQIGKFNIDIKGEKKSFKTLTLKNDSGQIKFYFFYGIHGNPKSTGKTAHIKQYNFLRNVEGEIIVDVLNINNPFHEMSEIYKIAKK